MKRLIWMVMFALAGFGGNKAGDIVDLRENSASAAIRARLRYGSASLGNVSIRLGDGCKEDTIHVIPGWFFAGVEVGFTDVSSRFSLRERFWINHDAKARMDSLMARKIEALQ